jgi:hypothetical protein
MTQDNDREPTLGDLADKLDRLTADVEHKLDRLTADVERFNDRFSNYQQATQWVVQLAFTLIASATLTVIITAILKR